MAPVETHRAILRAEDPVFDPRKPAAIFSTASAMRAIELTNGTAQPQSGERLIGVLPPVFPEYLGEQAFRERHGARFAYIVGEMARGIATPQMVICAARAGLIGFYGSAGLSIPEIERSLGEIRAALGSQARNWGANLIHSPHEPNAELAFAELAIRCAVPLVSASAFMRLSSAIVWLAAHGLQRQANGQIRRARSIVPKVSRIEVARQFLVPAPTQLLRALVEQRRISAEEADLAAQIPLADEITAEADSGGHTDNRPLSVLLPQICALAAGEARKSGHECASIGAAGGLGTPAAIAGAFALGAGYVVTGSINQAAKQSGLSPDAREMLASAESTDVAMAPAADMFELGVKVQVLKRGSLFAQRGQRLYDTYKRYAGLDEIPTQERVDLETQVLGCAIAEIWQETRSYFASRAPQEIERAQGDPKHKMALVFRWYLFMGAQWAREGKVERRSDYQIWCGPAMGAFNGWARGTFLEDNSARDVVQMALNLMEGAAHIARAQSLRAAGINVPAEAFEFKPRHLI